MHATMPRKLTRSWPSVNIGTLESRMKTCSQHTPDSAAIIQSSLDLAHWLFEHNPKEYTFEPLPADPHAREIASLRRKRQKIAMTLFEIAFEHHTAIVFLCQNHMRSTAFALARCLFDSMWQGGWVAYSASMEQIEEYQRGRYNPKPQKSIKSLEEAQGLPPSISLIYEHGWDELCSYNHGTYLQIKSWTDGDDIRPSHTDDEMRKMLRLCDQLAVVCAVFLAHICGIDPVPIVKEHDRLFPHF
jgi:hypothetical protein